MPDVALPPHPDGLPWPTTDWPVGEAPEGWGLDAAIDSLFADPDAGTTYAVAVAHRGRLVAERYGGSLEHWDRPAEVVGPGTPLLSWSVAKSVLHVAVGILVGQGRLDPGARAPVAAWGAPGDPRSGITLDHLLTMRDGLDWVEDYDPASERSDVISMLFGGVADMAAFAAERPLVAPPGTRYRYSSGTSNIVSGIVADVVGRGGDYGSWLHSALFDPIGMRSARPRFDDAGTWVASSYLHATARDWLRFGELALRDGVWEGHRLLPPGWLDHGRLARSPDEPPLWHGAHWWSERDRSGTFMAEGYEGQMVLVSPGTDLVVVRFGKGPVGSHAVFAWGHRLVAAVAATA